MEELEILDTPLFDAADMGLLLLRFGFNMVVTWLIIHFFYYRKSHRRDYYFTFTLISVSIFFLIFLLGGVKLKMGFALGLFAIFGIIRYRTETMPVREMTYLFVIISLSVINALAVTVSLVELLFANLLFIVAIWLCESNRWLRHVACKCVQYDRIELIKPDKAEELKADLSERTGLDIVNIEVGSIDFLRDMAMLKVYYNAPEGVVSTIDDMTKLPKNNEL